MSLKFALTVRINSLITKANSILEEWIRRGLNRNGYLPALTGSGPSLPTTTTPSFDLKDILDNGFVWCPTPKKRTTAEKKLTKRFLPLPNNFITKYARPKTNIITCLECGSYHEKGTICGKCYENVKQETEKVQHEMFKKEEFKYNHPAKEIAFMYEDDKENINQETLKNRVVVEVPKKRPSWFNSDLLTKITSKVNKN